MLLVAHLPAVSAMGKSIMSGQVRQGPVHGPQQFHPQFFAHKGDRHMKTEVNSADDNAKKRKCALAVVEEIKARTGIDITDGNYKSDPHYQELINSGKDLLGFPGGPMSYEELFERVRNVTIGDDGTGYDSIYDMGNPYQLSDEESVDSAVAKEIISSFGLDETETTIEDVLRKLVSKEGLVGRFKKFLNFDLDAFDKENDHYKRERCKILYLFFSLEHKIYPNINVLELLSKHSMENIDNSGIGWKTHNGPIVREVKEHLGKELTLDKKAQIFSTLQQISLSLDGLLRQEQNLLDFMAGAGIDYQIAKFPPLIRPGFVRESGSLEGISPIELLYLIVSKSEYLGQLEDIRKINETDDEKNNQNPVPEELVVEMKELHRKSVDIQNIEQYIKNEAPRLAKYVHLGKKVNRDDIRRIQRDSEKVQKWFTFILEQNKWLDARTICNDLQIVSCLQALILDNQSEVFKNSFYRYQDISKHSPRVQAVFKGEGKYIPDMLKRYWQRKVTDRWYANLGRTGERLKLRELEHECDKFRKSIFDVQILDDMREAFDLGYQKWKEDFSSLERQMESVGGLLHFLNENGFSYSDENCRIRYAFQNQHTMCILKTICWTIQDTIQNQDSFCEIDCPVLGLTLAFEFDYEKKECALTKFKPIPS